MKFGQLIIGLLLGAGVGYGLTKYLPAQTEKDMPSPPTAWDWPDSLDAVTAAPQNHKVVFEDSTVRVLQVLLDGHKEEPIHTHKWKSVMWIAKPAVPCTIYQYSRDKSGKFAATDSVNIPQMDTNMGFRNEAEAPTGIKNLGNDNGVAYRVEFKKEFKP